jgi:hypothetical protein
MGAPTAANDPTPQALEESSQWTHKAYSLYVDDEADLIGLVAYSLYKQHKIAFLSDEHARTKKPAAPEIVRAFCDAYSQPNQVTLLREKAERLLEEMNEQLLDETVHGLNAEYDKRLKKELKEGTPFWKSVRYSVAGNIATGIVFASMIWVANANFEGVLAALKKLFNIA